MAHFFKQHIITDISFCKPTSALEKLSALNVQNLKVNNSRKTLKLNSFLNEVGLDGSAVPPTADLVEAMVVCSSSRYAVLLSFRPTFLAVYGPL